MWRRFRLVLPPVGAMIGFLIACLAVEAPALYALWLGVPPLALAPLSAGLLAAGCLALGAFRVAVFHPGFNASYRKYLSQTPWTARKPLPMGPVHLVWEDVIIIGAFLAVGWAWTGKPVVAVVLLVLFLFPYLALLACALNRNTRAWPFGFIVAFGLGLSFRCVYWPRLLLGSLALTWLVATIGLRLSLSRFHQWDHDRIEDQTRCNQIRAGNASAETFSKLDAGSLGWPYDLLGPKLPIPDDGRFADAVFQSLLFGWWVYVAGAIYFDPMAGSLFQKFAIFLVAGAVIAGRLAVFLVGHAPPISLPGRLATFRWIIKGYDRVFVAPLLATAAVLLIPHELIRAGVPELIARPIGLTFCVFFALTTRPTLREWHLTGRHRLNFPSNPNQNKQTNWIQVG